MVFPGESSITHQQLRIFAAVARERSFGRAARSLLITEPAVSNHIRLLERVVGATLIERSRGRRSVELTGAGRMLLETCEAMFHSLEQGVSAIRRRYGPDPTTVVVGTGGNFGGSTLPLLIESFRRADPTIDVVIEVGSSHQLTEWLKQQAIHLAILGTPGDEEDLVYEPFMTFAVHLVGPAGHRLARPAPAPIEELASENFIAPGEPIASRFGIARMAAEAGVVLRVVMAGGDEHSRIQAVANGFGITPVHLAAPGLTALTSSPGSQLAVLNVDGFPLRLERHIAYRRGALPTAAAEFKLHLLRNRDCLEAGQPLEWAHAGLTGA